MQPTTRPTAEHSKLQGDAQYTTTKKRDEMNLGETKKNKNQTNKKTREKCKNINSKKSGAPSRLTVHPPGLFHVEDQNPPHSPARPPRGRAQTNLDQENPRPAESDPASRVAPGPGRIGKRGIPPRFPVKKNRGVPIPDSRVTSDTARASAACYASPREAAGGSTGLGRLPLGARRCFSESSIIRAGPSYLGTVVF